MGILLLQGYTQHPLSFFTFASFHPWIRSTPKTCAKIYDSGNVDLDALAVVLIS